MADDEELPVLTTTELGNLLKQGLRTLFPQQVWVEGQITGLRTPRAGHVYFDLIDPPEEPGQPAPAKFSVAMWRGTRTKVEKVLAEAGNLALENDLQVRILVKLDFYVPHGRLQLIMEGIDPSFTLGKLAADRDRLLRALADEGLIDQNRNVFLADPPLRVGLVTSIGSAAHADFVTELENSGFGFNLLVCDTRVQGEGAAEQVAHNLQVVASHKPDVVALVRGGGSAADLLVFDNELVARTITALPVPVFTGIGHEIDQSVADLVAHKSFKTPTACAGALVDAVRLYDDLLTGLRTALGERVHVVLDHAQQRQDHLSQRITQSASHAINRQSDRLKNLCQRLVITAPQRLDRCHDQLETQVLQLRALDPARVLARGWSITRTVDGGLITHVGDVSAADELITTLADGTVSSTVTAKEVSS